MKFCSECGKRYGEPARFCPSCGVKLRDIIEEIEDTPSVTDVADSTEVININIANEQIEGVADDKSASTHINQAMSESKKGMRLIQIKNVMAIVFIVIIGIGGYVYKSPEQQVKRVIDGYMSVVVLNSQLEKPHVEDLQMAIEYVSDDVAQSYMKEIEDVYSKNENKEQGLKINSDPFHFYYYMVRDWEIENIAIMNNTATIYVYMRNYIDYPEDNSSQTKIFTMENRSDKWCITAIKNEEESDEI